MELEEQDYVALMKILLRHARKAVEKKYPEDWDHEQLLDNIVEGAKEELYEEDRREEILQKEIKEE